MNFRFQVTVSGVSAGAALTAVQMLAPRLDKLVRGAVRSFHGLPVLSAEGGAFTRFSNPGRQTVSEPIPLPETSQFGKAL